MGKQAPLQCPLQQRTGADTGTLWCQAAGRSTSTQSSPPASSSSSRAERPTLGTRLEPEGIGQSTSESPAEAAQAPTASLPAKHFLSSSSLSCCLARCGGDSHRKT